MADFLTDPVPNVEASDFVRKMPAVPRRVFDGLLPDLKAYAFTITGIENTNLLQDARDAIAAVPLGHAWEDVKDDLVDQLTPWLGDKAERRADLLLRMHCGRAYAVGQYRLQEAQKDVFPFVMWQHSGLPKHPREAHLALDGKVFPWDSKYLQSHYPPDGFNCHCQVVPISRADHAELLADDEGKPAHQRRVLDGAILRDVEESERIMDPAGNGAMVDLRRAAGDPGWLPGLLQLPLDKIAAKYDPDIWAGFETWAKATEVEDVGSIWDWLVSVTPGKAGKAAARKVATAKAAKKAAAVAAGEALAVEPAGTAFAAQVNVTVKSGVVATAAHDALATVERIHGDGGTKLTDLVTSRQSSYGWYHPVKNQIGVRASGDHKQMTIWHELGHKIDYEAIGGSAKAQRARAVLGGGAVNPEAHAACRRIIETLKGTPTMRQVLGNPALTSSYADYLTTEHEIFARAYAQYVATESGHVEGLRQLNAARSAKDDARRLTQWPDEEFAPAMDYFRGLFRALGWMAQPATV